MLLLEEFEFLSWGFRFSATSRFSYEQSSQFVAWNIRIFVFLPILFSWFCWFAVCSYFAQLLMVAVINLSLVFLIYSSIHCIDASPQSSRLGNPLPPFFLDTYSMPILSLGYKVLYIVINFLIRWPICLSSFFIPFKIVQSRLLKLRVPWRLHGSRMFCY